MPSSFNPATLHDFDEATVPTDRLILLYPSRGPKVIPWIGSYIEVAGGGWHHVDPWTGGCRPIPIHRVVAWSELGVDTTHSS